MTLLAQLMGWVFIAAWAVGLAASIYASQYFFRKPPGAPGDNRKMRWGYAVSVGAVAIGFLAGWVAQLAGGWR